MKVLYSSLKQYIPTLETPAREVADVLTSIGYMAERFEEVTYNNQQDYLISLEVRQNRADCFSVIGIAREVAAYYGLPFEPPVIQMPALGTTVLPITIEAQKPIQRVLALQLDGLIQQSSPVWLKDFLELHGMNSINLFVDISNYVMILTGYSSHLIDASVVKGGLKWDMNTQFESIETLDGSKYELSTDSRYLIIHDENAPIALAGIVGSRYGAISSTTTSVIAEMAVYDASVIRDNMRSLHIVTEAGNRLSKDIDSDQAYDAFCLLVSLLVEHTKGTPASSLFEYYPHASVLTVISFDPLLPSRISGIAISLDQVKTILTRLLFEVNDQGELWDITVPLFRTDVSCPEDVAEEVIRMVGYDTIPTDIVPALPVTPDITPLGLRWADTIEDILMSRGYDEIRSLPLVSSELNTMVKYRDDGAITTKNAVNEEYPELRNSLLTGILLQKEQYKKRNVDLIRIFEYGKAFGMTGKQYREYEMITLASLSSNGTTSNFGTVHADIIGVLARMSLRATLQKSTIIPLCANPYSCWDIIVAEKRLGICFVLNDPHYPDGAVAEVDINMAIQCMGVTSPSSVAELTTKLVDLDTNVVCSGDEELGEYINGLYRTLAPHVWSVIAIDRYPLTTGIRYTLRVTYRELSDTDAKALHLKTFELNT